MPLTSTQVQLFTDRSSTGEGRDEDPGVLYGLPQPERRLPSQRGFASGSLVCSSFCT